MRNKFFWIGIITLAFMLIFFFISRYIDVFINNVKPTFTFDPIFYIIPVTFILGGIINWEKKPNKKKLIYFAESYLNNALKFIDDGNIDSAKSEIKWALKKSNMKVRSEINEQ